MTMRSLSTFLPSNPMAYSFIDAFIILSLWLFVSFSLLLLLFPFLI